MRLQDQLNEILNDISLVGSETCLLLAAITLLIVGLINKNERLIKGIFSASIISSLYLNLKIKPDGLFLSNSLFLNKETISFGSLFLIFGLGVLVFPRKKHVTEFYFFILALLLGSLFMIKANSLLILYLSIELVSFVSYILTNFSFTKDGHEAGIKYLLFGALSSAMMLVGIGLVYGTTHSFYISQWSPELFSTLLSQLGILFLMFGILFKCAVFPFHSWTPATYQAAPVDATAIFSIIPKLAGLILLKHIFFNIGLEFSHWLVVLLLAMGLASIIVGTLGAMKQSNIRRMISFGSIAHSGFLFGIIIAPADSHQDAFWWYAVAYGLMNLAAFYIIDRYESLSIYTHPQYAATKHESLMAVAFTLVLVSLVGIPPLAGFSAKLLLFSSLWEIFLVTDSKISLSYLLISVFATVASLFFYLRVPYQVFLSEENDEISELSSELSFTSKIIATLFGITLLMLFFAPKMVMSLQLLLNNVYE